MNGIKGILNIIKPSGMTSFDVVQYMRRVLNIKKIGHTGTLDPGATGILLLCIGRATRAIEYMSGMDKSYRAELTLGVSTDTQDSYGKVLDTRKVNVSKEQIEKVMKSFAGRYEQVPPMYSAVKIGGRKLYELAREGMTVRREPRQVRIYSIDIIHMADTRKILFDVSCSKGTYIRTLCADIGERLGCGGHMSFLLRTKVGHFHISSAFTLEDIDTFIKQNNIEEILTGTDEVFKAYKALKLNTGDEKRFVNGVPVSLNGTDFKLDEIIRIYGKDGFKALGEVTSRNGELFLKLEKLF